MGGLRGGGSAASLVARRRPWVDPVVLGTVGAIWSAVAYGRPSVWTDEAATISAANRSLPRLWALVHRVDAVHGLYYALMHFWVRVFGISTWSIRLPSVIFAGGAVAGTVVLGRLLAGPTVGVWAGVVMAVLPRTTWAATQARSPAATMFVVAWLTVLLVLAYRRGRWWWVAYGALAFVSVLLFLYLLLVILAHGLTVAWWNRRRWRASAPYAAAAGAALLATIPFIHLSLHESGQIHPRVIHAGWVVPGMLVEQWFFGFAPRVAQSFVGWQMPLWGWGAVLTALGCFALAGWGLRRALTGRPALGPYVVLVPIAVVPTVVLVGFSLAHPVYSPRYLAFAAPAVAVLVALGVVALSRRRTRVGVVLAVLLATVPVWAVQRSVVADKGTDWSTVAGLLAARARPGDTVVLPRPPLHGQAARIPIAYPAPFAGLRDVTLRQTPACSDTLWGTGRPLTPALLADAPRVWLLADARARFGSARRRLTGQIESAGYRPTWGWHGTLTDVLEFVPGPR